LPFYALVGLGCSSFLEWVNQCEMLSFQKSRKYIPLILIMVVAIYSISYQLTKGRLSTSWNCGTGFIRKTIPLDFLQNTLEKHNVILREAEFSGGQFDLLIYTHYPRLVARYNTHRPIGTIKVFKTLDVLPKPDTHRPSIYMTWSTVDLINMVERKGLCVPDAVINSQDTNTPYWGYLAQPEYPRNSCISYAGSNGSVGEKISFAFDKYERLRHVLDCEGDGCGPDRKEFIYSSGGIVSFLLSRPTGSKKNLRITVTNPDPNRHSIVEVNGVFIGDLEIKTLKDNIANLPIPPSAERANENWVIRILPSKDKNSLGWDIISAELVSSI